MSNQEVPEKRKRGLNFLYEVKQELSRTSWTPKKELFSLVKIVIGSTFVFGFFLFFVDVFLKNALQLLKTGFSGLFG